MPDDLDTLYEQWKANPKNKGKAAMFAETPAEQGVKTSPYEAAVWAKKNLPSIGALGATGLALDAVLPEVGIPATIARAALLGGENVALNKGLPEEYGGQPQSSATESFLTGALPEIGVAGGGKMIEKLAERKLAGRTASALEQGAKKLDPEALEPQRMLMEPRGRIPYPNRASGAQLTEQTFGAQTPTIETVNAARTKYGAPIGDAYKAIKGADNTISESAARELAEDAQGIRSDLIAPAPKSQAFFAKLQAYAPKAPESPIEAVSPEQLAMMPADQREYFSRLFGDEKPPEAEKKPPTLDELREARQQVNTALRTAKGGDVYALGRLQDRIDQELLPHLPDNMQQLRREYAGFINRWGYQQQQAFQRLKTPQEVSDWVFSDPARAHDLFAEAAEQGPQAAPVAPQGIGSETKVTINGKTTTIRSGAPVNPPPTPTNPRLEALRGQFLQYLYGDLDVTQSGAKQAAEVRKRLAPYMSDPATAKLVMGPQWRSQLQMASAWPRYVAEFNDRLDKDPSFRQSLEKGIRSTFLAKGVQPEQAMTALTSRYFGNQGGPELEHVVQGLPAPVEKAARNSGINWRQPLYHGSVAAMGAVTGHTMGMPWQIGMGGGYLLSHLATTMGFGTASKMGITRQILKAMAQKNGAAAGRIVARALLNAGARETQQKIDEPVDLNQ